VVSSASGSAGSTTTTIPKPRPLSSLGHLQPAPYPGDVGGELVPIPLAPALASPALKATPTSSVDGITRYADGLIHIETPVQRAFVLGEFFDLWGSR
jgi:hypothetical protein